jgi:hypothetical protein
MKDLVDTPKLWRDMTDAEKGALLLAYHDDEVIDYFSHSTVWRSIDQPMWNPGYAYRIKPKAPKVEKIVEYFTYFPGEGLGFASELRHANISIAYIITDGIVTACDTIIHD